MPFSEIAERLAIQELRRRGFDVQLTAAGADGELDVVDPLHGVAAQVRATQAPVDTPALQQLVSAAKAHGLDRLVFFSTGGYSQPAKKAATDLGIALFAMDFAGRITPANADAESFIVGTYGANALVWSSVEDSNDHYGAGLALAAAGRDEEAMFWWRKGALAGDANCMAALGTALRHAEDTEAEEWLRRAVYEEQHADAADSLGRLYEDRGDHPLAHEVWLYGAETLMDGTCMWRLGIICERERDAAAAENFFRRSIAAHSVPAMGMLASLLEWSGRYDEAEHWYRQSLEAGDSSSCAALGFRLRERGQAQEAELAYRRGADAGDEDSLIGLTELLVEAGRVEEAVQVAREVSPANSNGVYCIGKAFERAGRIGEAEYWYREGVHAGHTSFYHLLSELLIDAGRLNEAEQCLISAIEAGDDSIWALVDLLQSVGRVADAEQWLRLGIGTDSRYIQNLAIHLHHAGRISEAEHWYRKGIEAGQDDCWRLLGLLLVGCGRAEAAEACYRAAIAADVLHCREPLAHLLRDLGRTDEALEIYLVLVEEDDGLGDHVTLAETFEQLGRIDEAERWLRYEVDEYGESLWDLAEFLRRQERTDEAEALYRRAIEGGETMALQSLGEMCEAGGRTDEAEHWYRQAIGAGMEESRALLARLLRSLGRPEEAMELDAEVAAAASATTGEPAWVAGLLASEVWQLQREAAGARAPLADDRVRAVLSTLHRRGGVASFATITAEAAVPAARLAGFLSHLTRLLNVDGYAVLDVDDAAAEARLSLPLLAQQFEITVTAP